METRGRAATGIALKSWLWIKKGINQQLQEPKVTPAITSRNHYHTMSTPVIFGLAKTIVWEGTWCCRVLSGRLTWYRAFRTSCTLFSCFSLFQGFPLLGRGREWKPRAGMANESGEQEWRTIIDHSIVLSCTSVYHEASRYCKKVMYSTSGDVVSLSEGHNDYNSSNSCSVYVERFSLDGLPRKL
jgi:hypothetical protein